MKRRLPPYGRQVAYALKRGKAPNLWIYGGTLEWQGAAWRTENIGPATALALPPGADPDDYRWPVKGLEVFLLWIDGYTLDNPRQDVKREELLRFAARLIQDGASLVVTLFEAEGFLYVRPTAKRCAA